MRCFISINLPKEIKEKIFHASELLYKKSLFKGKVTEKENLHLTLKFLGDISEEQIEKTKKKLKEINSKKFEASIGEAGIFNENLIRIIWLKINNIGPLQQEIDEALNGLFPKEARFMSHLTIARVKFAENKSRLLEEIKKIKFKDKFIVKDFELMKSELFPNGPRYKPLSVFSLKD